MCFKLPSHGVAKTQTHLATKPQQNNNVDKDIRSLFFLLPQHAPVTTVS